MILLAFISAAGLAQEPDRYASPATVMNDVFLMHRSDAGERAFQNVLHCRLGEILLSKL